MDIPETLGPLFDDFSQSCLNPVEDTDLSGILDGLQEGTLLSLMQDENLFKEVDDDALFLSFTADNEELSTIELEDFLGTDMDVDDLQIGVDTSKNTNPVFQESAKVDSGVEFSIGGEPVTMSDEPEAVTLKCGKSLDNCTQNSSGASLSSTANSLVSVQHDHCYTSEARQDSEGDHLCCKSHRPSTASEGDVSSDRDEGNNSDAGYDTMSASTSPGNTNSSPENTPRPSRPTTTTTTSTAASLPPLASKLDPVALIDARIQHFMCSQQISLTKEEKETLKTEGLPIPTTLPLTKVEEKALKSVRRKLRNKTAARESRKRKKEQLTDLEDKVELFNTENLRLKKRVESLESENRSLLSQLRKLQTVVASTASGTARNKTHVGACLMVVVLCFAVFFGNWNPHRMSSPASDYTTSSVRSRSLLSVEGPQNFQSMACNWFRHIFMGDDSDGGYGSVHGEPLSPRTVYGPVAQPGSGSGSSKQARAVMLETLSLESNTNKSKQSTQHIAVKQ